MLAYERFGARRSAHGPARKRDLHPDAARERRASVPPAWQPRTAPTARGPGLRTADRDRVPAPRVRSPLRSVAAAVRSPRRVARTPGGRFPSSSRSMRRPWVSIRLSPSSPRKRDTYTCTVSVLLPAVPHPTDRRSDARSIPARSDAGSQPATPAGAARRVTTGHPIALIKGPRIQNSTAPSRVERSGGPLSLGGQRQRALLALLVLRRNEQVLTSRLIDDLWGEEPPATAQKTVQVYVSRLRGELGESRIETHGRGYMLRLDEGNSTSRCSSNSSRGANGSRHRAQRRPYARRWHSIAVSRSETWATSRGHCPRLPGWRS